MARLKTNPPKLLKKAEQERYWRTRAALPCQRDRLRGQFGSGGWPCCHTRRRSARPPSILFLSGAPLNVRAIKRLRQAWGILPLDTSAEELLAVIHTLSQGLIVGPVSLLFPQEEETSDRGLLTDRESEVMNLLAKGMANKQIALALSISEHTVKFHVSSIYTKLNVTNRTEAVREGLRAGWIAL